LIAELGCSEASPQRGHLVLAEVKALARTRVFALSDDLDPIPGVHFAGRT